jgi:predicted ATP-grasp superfamily ATP-dependent carboligase
MTDKILLLDGYSSRTLACVRSFGRHGLPFAVGGRSRWDFALHSRYARETFVYTSPFVDVNGFLEDVTEAVGRFSATEILPTSEAAIMACSTHREVLPVPFLGPTPEQIELLFDKERTLELAGRLGLRVPRTLAVTGTTPVADIYAALDLPVILKAGSSELLDGRKIRRGGDTVYIFSRDDLARELDRKLQRTPTVLVQQFIDGHGVGVSGVFAGGRPVALFGHRRLHESTPTGGPSAVAVSIAVDGELRDHATRLMGETGYTGPAMVEFKVDGRTGEPYLMEVNARLWGSILLPLAAGIDIPYILWKVWHDESVTEAELTYRIGLVGRYLFGDTKHLLLALRGRPRGWPGEFPGRWPTLRDYAGMFFRRDVRTLLLTADDPRPFFGRFFQELFG